MIKYLAISACLALLCDQCLYPVDPIFSNDVASITISVNAIDRHGVTLKNLGKEDFELLENGKASNLDVCEFRSIPLDIIIISDMHSTDGLSRSELAPLANLLRMLPIDDRVGGLRMSYGKNQFVQVLDFDHLKVMRTFNRNRSFGREREKERIADAVIDASKRFDSPPTLRRRVVLLLTDDLDNGSQHTIEEAYKELTKENVTLMELVTHNSMRASESWCGVLSGLCSGRVTSKVGSSVQQLAQDSGGEVIELGKEDLELSARIERLRNTYLVSFRAKEGVRPEVRDVSIDLNSTIKSEFPGYSLYYSHHFLYVPKLPTPSDSSAK